MSTPARIRILLVVAVAILGASVSLVLSAQRANLVRGQAQTAVAGDLLSAMLDQETAVRGFDQTGLEEFLAPYQQGRAAFDAALVDAEHSVDGDDDETAEQLRRQEATARRWQALAAHAIAEVRGHGSRSLTVEGARVRKALMDDFRRHNASFRRHLAAQVDEELDDARRSAIVLVVVIGTLLLGGGLLLVEHSARRAARRRRAEREFVETLQGAEDEDEAQDVLRRHIQRSLDGADAVMLRRNASGNLLTGGLPPDAPPGLAARLDGAASRDCLAIRRGAAYARREGDEPLQPCNICGVLPGSSRCMPSLVGGEVVGSLLVTRNGGIDAPAEETLTRAVAQAAPVLANLRNLAIAEHRAATDGLTGLPNARSVRETLTRMVAQAARSETPLAALALDLDHFKALNDRYGHQAGDEALAAVGAALAAGVRESDFAGRWGGEEFVVLLPDTDVAGAAVVAEKLREAIAAVRLAAVPSGLAASLGVAALPTHARTGEELLRAADRALYAAKASGRNRVEIAGAAPEAPATAGSR